MGVRVVVGVVEQERLVGAGSVVYLQGPVVKVWPVLVKFPSLQDLQHICLYPRLEQYLFSTSIRQNADLSPLHCLEEILGPGSSGLARDSHWIKAFLPSPVQGTSWQVLSVMGLVSTQSPTELSELLHRTFRSWVPLPHVTEHWDQGPTSHLAKQSWRLQGRRPSGLSSLQYLLWMVRWSPPAMGCRQRTERVW